MGRFNRNRITDFLNRSDNAQTADTKGEIFEDLVIYLFTRCQGVRLIERNILDDTGAREYDVALGNNRVLSPFDYLDPIIICECKNEAHAIGSDNVRDFHQKLRTSGANIGIIISSNGVSGQARGNNRQATTAIIDALTMDKIKIIVITRAEILALRTTDDLSNLIWEKYSKLILKRATG
ncbi:MAG: hypothetical protein EHM58_16805 [Ignavibacteriae bacterium]|nr:MAG: hypothetical protein EHM58_16805 [Ignavibacteriota bacterium]